MMRSADSTTSSPHCVAQISGYIEVSLADLAGALGCAENRRYVTSALREVAWFGVSRFGVPPVAEEMLSREFGFEQYDPRKCIAPVGSHRWKVFTESLLLPEDPSFMEGGAITLRSPEDKEKVLARISSLCLEMKACLPFKARLSREEVAACIEKLEHTLGGETYLPSPSTLLLRQLHLTKAFGGEVSLLLLEEAKLLNKTLLSVCMAAIHSEAPGPSLSFPSDSHLEWRWSDSSKCWGPAFIGSRFKNSTLFDLPAKYFEKQLECPLPAGIEEFFTNLKQYRELGGGWLASRQLSALERYLQGVISKNLIAFKDTKEGVIA